MRWNSSLICSQMPAPDQWYDLRILAGCFCLSRKWIEFDLKSSLGLCYKKWMVGLIGQGGGIYAPPLDSQPREVEGLDVGKVEALIPRSGVDSAGRNETGPASPRSPTVPSSLLALLRVRRCFFGTGRKSLHFISSRRRCRLV